MAKKKAKRATVTILQNESEAADVIRDIGTAMGQIEKVAADLNKAVTELQTEAREITEPLTQTIREKVDSLYQFAEAHRPALTDNGKTRTVKLATGTMSWRTTPPAVSITDVEEVLERVKQLELTQFIRTKEELNKDAMLADRNSAESIAGVQITQKEEFVIRPLTIEAEVVHKIRKSKKKKK